MANLGGFAEAPPGGELAGGHEVGVIQLSSVAVSVPLAMRTSSLCVASTAALPASSGQ
ncbi:hypothetical protein ABT115_15805 [Streptomyces sp. NPDC001832]|uniref:hypothetical protein n=1 Tax=Streptomyces sp. NPDC001832 TaxID=3154527 RepID=UPI003326170F